MLDAGFPNTLPLIPDHKGYSDGTSSPDPILNANMAAVNPYGSSEPIAPRQRASHAHPAQLTPGRITLAPKSLVHPLSIEPVSDLLYSGFVEHLGRGIYGGIVDDPNNPSPPELLVQQEDPKDAARTAGRLGWRKDVMKILGKDGDLEMPVLRWPGGNFVSNYHWKDGVGPVAERPKRLELAWLSTEGNKFGTDEFIDYCRGLGVEPYFCLNMGTGSYEEALEWVEYCNSKADTHLVNLRKKNTGREEPHNVRFWGLGNEVYGSWQVGKLTASDYVKMASRWAHGLRLVDPSIKLVSCGELGTTEWDREVLQGLIDVVDYHSIHLYTMLGHERYSAPGLDYEKNVFGPAAAERCIDICTSLIEHAKLSRSSFGGEQSSLVARDVKICYDEWNVWDDVKAPGSAGLEQTYDYTDMLGVVAWLNVLVRKHHEVGMACIAQSVNVISPLMTSKDSLLFQTTYWPLRLFSRYMKNGRLLNLASTSTDVYTGPTYPYWIQHIAPPAYIDMVGICVQKTPESKTVSIRLSILNRHPTVDWETQVDTSSLTSITSVEKHEIYSDDLAAKNTFESPDVVVPLVSTSDKLPPSLTVRKHSWVFLIIEATVE